MPAALGGRLTGARAERAARSAQFRDGTFHNRVAVRTMPGGDPDRSLLRELLFGQQRRRPTAPVPLLRPAPAPTTGVDRELSIVWYGHASALVEIEGHRVLIDPVWSDRCSPSAAVGPKRLHAPPVRLDELPTVNAILISHDHYDHLDMTTVRELVRRQSAPFLVPLGVGAHLDRWGCRPTGSSSWTGRSGTGSAAWRSPPPPRSTSPAGPAARRHAVEFVGGRRGAPEVFYTGDSGYFDGYAEIGAEHGPFDATLMQIGAYDRAWPGIHMFPEEAVTAHLELRGGLLVPVHWATFNLALHDWSEPVDRLWAEAKARDVRLAVPRPGERVVVDDPPPVDGWWQTVA